MKEFKTVDGHIYPDQEFALQELKGKLTDLITNQVKQNLK